jgi:hypothetical protein
MVLLWSAALRAEGGSFVAPGGATFQPPSGWVVAPEDSRLDAQELARQGVPRDPNRLQLLVLLVDPNDAAGRAMLSLQATEGILNVTNDSIRFAEKSVRAAYERSGYTVGGIASRRTQAADRKAILVEANVRVPGAADAIREWRVLVPSGKGMLCLVCLAGEGDFPRYEADFARAVATLQPPPDPGGGKLWAKSITAFGMLLLAWILLRNARRRTAAARREAEP